MTNSQNTQAHLKLGGAIAAHLAYHPLNGSAAIVVFNADHPYLGALRAILVLTCAWIGVWLRYVESHRSFNKARDFELRSAKAKAA